MLHIIRLTALLIFIILTFLVSACDASVVKKQKPGRIEKPLVKQDNKLDVPKIIAFGDSLTAGFELTEKEPYPYLLQKKLVSDGFQYEVINAGQPGDTSRDGLERVDSVLAQEKVEIFILELGANDFLQGIPVKNMKDSLEKIIQKVQLKNIDILLCGMLADDRMGAEYKEDYINSFTDLASKYQLHFVPFILEGVALDPKLNQEDGIHPNAEGTRIMTANVYKVLKQMLVKSD